VVGHHVVAIFSSRLRKYLNRTKEAKTIKKAQKLLYYFAGFFNPLGKDLILDYSNRF
jgi:hypothetical protein